MLTAVVSCLGKFDTIVIDQRGNLVSWFHVFGDLVQLFQIAVYQYADGYLHRVDQNSESVSAFMIMHTCVLNTYIIACVHWM